MGLRRKTAEDYRALAKKGGFKLIAAGWKILHIKSNNEIPAWEQLLDAITWLQTGKESQVEIILDDWGKGSTFAETRT